jgi:hypothetical protein
LFPYSRPRPTADSDALYPTIALFNLFPFGTGSFHLWPRRPAAKKAPGWSGKVHGSSPILGAGLIKRKPPAAEMINRMETGTYRSARPHRGCRTRPRASTIRCDRLAPQPMMTHRPGCAEDHCTPQPIKSGNTTQPGT